MSREEWQRWIGPEGVPCDVCNFQARAQVYRWTITSLNNIEPYALPIFFADLQSDANSHGRALRSWYVDLFGRFFPKIDETLAVQAFIIGVEFTVTDITLMCELPAMLRKPPCDREG